MIPKTYLGDGVYAEIDRGMIKLTTQRDTGEHVIWLEPDVLEALQEFSERAIAAAKAETEAK